MQPLLMFLSQTPTLSEPLLWFILQVLDNEDSIKMFHNTGKYNLLLNCDFGLLQRIQVVALHLYTIFRWNHSTGYKHCQ